MIITDEKLNILQNLEFSVVHIWRSHSEMTDYVMQRAYDAVYRLYRAELRGQAPKPPVLSGLEATTFEALKAECDFQLGRGADPRTGTINVKAISVQLLMDCLRELGKSVERHANVDGRQGYLTFIDTFLP